MALRASAGALPLAGEGEVGVEPFKSAMIYYLGFVGRMHSTSPNYLKLVFIRRRTIGDYITLTNNTAFTSQGAGSTTH